MPISARVRFEVFKRDGFTCAYCGRTPPEVLLQADHIVPVAAGGSDEIHNLITSCQTCNLGKGARMLEEGTAPVVGHATVEELQERIAQAKAYMEALTGHQAVIQDQVAMVIEAWAKAYGAELEEREDGHYWVFRGYGRWPDERSIRRFLRSLSLEAVLQAVDVTAGRLHYPNDAARRYFYGVCWRSIREGRSPMERSSGLSRDGEDESSLDRAFDEGWRAGRVDVVRSLRDMVKRSSGALDVETLEAVIEVLWDEDELAEADDHDEEGDAT